MQRIKIRTSPGLAPIIFRRSTFLFMFPSVLLLAAAVMILVVAIPSSTSAHAGLDRSLPAADAQLDTSPSQVEMWFSEELGDGSTATVTGPDGQRVDNSDAALDLFDLERKHLVVTLMPNLPPGVHTVSWTSVSGEDDDTESGSFEFTVEDSGTPVASPAAAASPSASPASSPPSGNATPESDESADIALPPGKTPGPDGTDLLAGIGVGLGAAALIYGFWLLVKPRRPRVIDR